MAGAGFKDFAVGEVLTASDVDTYLMQQSVMRFADSAARGSALGTATGTAVPLAEGMVAYLDDVDSVQVYSGTVWEPVTNAGIGTNVVQTVTTTPLLVNTSGSYQNWSGFAATITPTRSNSKVLVVLTVSSVSVSAATQDVQITATSGTSPFGYTRNYLSTSGQEVYGNTSVMFLHSPATSSAVTYQVQVDGGPFRGNTGNETSTLTLIEVRV